MDDGGAVGGGRLAGADVHAPVDLHRIDGDDLGPGNGESGGHGDVRLARRRRAEQDDGRHYCGEHRDANPVGRLGQHLDEATGQVVRCGARDLHVGVRAWSERARRPEMDEAVLRGAGRRDGRVLLARALDQHLLRPTDPGFVGGERRPLDDDAEAVEPVTGDFGCDEAVGQEAASVPGRGEKMNV